MALPKKKSRKITIDGIDFRYAISISWKDNGLFDFNITIQEEKSNGSKLFLKGLVTRDFWLDFSDIGKGHIEIDRNSYPTITPRHIAYFVNKGLCEGWDFSIKEKDFWLDVNNRDLLR